LSVTNERLRLRRRAQRTLWEAKRLNQALNAIIAEIGLVHLSGVDDPRPREQLTDNERIMLTPQDRQR
jgi:predicted xylose isomerase-like sugar epimerase